MVLSWLRALLQRQTRTTRRSRPAHKRKGRTASGLSLEALEDRCVPALLAPVGYNAGFAPSIITTGDFNGDGKLDLVTGNHGFVGFNTPTVSVLLGNGNGTFGAALTSPPLSGTPGSPYTGAQGHTMATADFNGDGKLDLALVSGQNGSVLLGNGDGTFQAPLSVVLGPSPTRISAADVNGDGHADLMAANTDGTVSVLLGNGDGTFAPLVAYAAGTDAQDVKAADLNGDGKPDLVVANGVSAGSIDVLLGNGDGSFQPYHAYPAFSAPYELEVGDFNGDGHVDVVAPNSYTSSFVTYLPGNGDGTLGPSHSFSVGTQPWDIATGDFNNDGKLDLIEGTNGPGFEIESGNGDGTFGSVQLQSAPTATNFAVGDFNGDGATDVAGTGSQSGTMISVQMNSDNGLLTLANAASLGVSAATSTVAGTPLAVTVTALDASGNVAAGYQDTVTFSSSDVQAGLPASYTFTAADAGRHTFSVTLKRAGTQSVTVTDTAHATVAGSQSGITVSPAAASRIVVGYLAPLVISGAPDLNAGDSQILDVWPSDPYGNFATGYLGTVNFTSSDPQAVLPASYTFTGDGLVQRFPVSFRTAGHQSFIVTDSVSPTVTGSVNFLVGNAAPASFSVSGPLTTAAGVAQNITVTSRDAFGNVVTGWKDLLGGLHNGYTGAVTFSSSDALAGLPAAYTFTAADAGVHTFSVTFKTLGTQSVTATDTASPTLTGTLPGVIVTPAPISSLALRYPAANTAGVAQPLTVTVGDILGNVATDYTGTVTFSSSDVQAGLPATYTFTASDAGVHTFSVTLKTAGTQTINARDMLTATLAGSTVVQVSAAAASTFQLTGGSGTAGLVTPVTIIARDPYGNLASGYNGTVHFTSSDTKALLPANTTLSGGTATVSVRMMTAGTQTLTAADTTTAAISGTETVTVTPAVLAGFDVTGFPSTTAGQAHTFTVTVRDTTGQVMSGYAGTVLFSSSDFQAGLPASYAFTASDKGSHVFTATLKTAGVQSISVRDSANGAVAGTESGIAVTAAAAASFTVSGFPATVAGVAHTFTVTVRDAYGNLASGYTGTVKFTSTDAQASLPANYTFSAADGGIHTFTATLKTAAGSQNVGGQTITAQDASSAALVGSETNILVSNAALAGFAISVPSNIAPGTPFTLKVAAVDAFGNEVGDYRGTVHFSDTLAALGLPPDYTFTSADNGQHSFTVTLSTTGTQTISVVDTANPLLTASVTVNVGATGGGGGGGGTSTGGGGTSTGGGGGGSGAGGGGGKRIA